jgi:spartin
MTSLFLRLPAVALSTETSTELGTLLVECTSDSPTILALTHNSHSFRIVSGSNVALLLHHSGEREYTFESAIELDEKSSQHSVGSIKITIAPPDEDTAHIAEDIATFDLLLTQYTDLSWAYAPSDTKSPVPPPLPARSSPPRTLENEPHVNIKQNVEDHKPVKDSSLRGRLVLMDDTNGDVLGELPQTLHITEDSALPSSEKTDDAAPVVLELQPDMYDAVTGVRPLGAEGEELLGMRDVFVSAVPREERDWIMNGATLIRCVHLHHPSYTTYTQQPIAPSAKLSPPRPLSSCLA